MRSGRRRTVASSALAVTLTAALAGLPGCTLSASSGAPEAPEDEAGRPMGLTTPCDGVPSSDLGRPFADQDPAFFTTSGGRTYFSVATFPKGGIFDPDVGRATLWLGPVDDLPSYDARSGQVPQASVRSGVIEDTWTAVDLDPGRYWVWVTNGSDVSVLTCTTGAVTEVVPARLP